MNANNLLESKQETTEAKRKAKPDTMKQIKQAFLVWGLETETSFVPTQETHQSLSFG